MATITLIMEFLLALLWMPLAVPHELTETLMCSYACEQSFGYLMFGTSEETEDRYTGECKDTLRWRSIFLCAKKHCTEDESHAGWHYFSTECEEHTGTALPSFESIIANITPEEENNVQIIQWEDYRTTDIINTTALPTDDLFGVALENWNVLRVTFVNHHNYGWAMYGFWGIVLLVGMLNRLFAFIVSRSRSMTAEDPEGRASHRNRLRRLTSVRSWTRRHLLLPATFGYRHLQPLGWCTIPTRLQSILVAVFVALNVILCAVDYHALSRNLFWPTTSLQISRYVADRTGIIAFANLPLLWLFAGRNNVFLWLTGWSFATYSVFHRWVARVTTVEAIIHSIAYTTCMLLDPNGAQLYRDSWKEEYWYTGAIATIAMSLMLGLSIYPLRQRLYELFLTLHISFALITLVCLFYHVKIWKGKYDPYLWPCVAIWVFDHAVRLARLAVLNFKVIFFRRTKAVVTYDEQHNVMRLSISPSCHSRPRPGTHYFLYFPTLIKAAGNHPFSLASWQVPMKRAPESSMSKSTSTSTVVTPIDRKHEAMTTANDLDMQSSDSGSGECEAYDEKEVRLSFIIRPHRGLTKHVRNSIMAAEGRSKKLTILLEGPYGKTQPIFGYDTILLIAGGSGISVISSYVQFYLESFSSTSYMARPTKRVHIVWVARQLNFVASVVEKELRPAASRPGMKLDLYITRSAAAEVKQPEQDQTPANGTMTTHYQRPVMAEMIRAEVDTAIGRTALLVCGPAQMADDARRAAVEVVRVGHDDLGYFEEAFGW